MTDRWEAFRQRLEPRPSGKCLIGLSGGADSVALTRILLPMRDAGEIEIEAIHVNHGIRGPEADGDEAFVRKFCAENGVTLHTIRLDLAGREDENTAREARYRAYAQVLRDLPKGEVFRAVKLKNIPLHLREQAAVNVVQQCKAYILVHMATSPF